MLNFADYLLFENHPYEIGHDHTSGDHDKPWFIILLGGSGTGKGSLISSDQAIGEIGDYVGGKTFSSASIKKQLEAGEEHIRSVFEPDRVLRLVQYDVAVDDYEGITKSDPKKKLSDVLRVVLGPDLNELKDYLAKKLGNAATVEDFLRDYKKVEDYCGKKYMQSQTGEHVESIDLQDALEDAKVAGGDSTILYLYQQMRKRHTSISKNMSMKEYAVDLANDAMKDHLSNFKNTFDRRDDVKIKNGSVVLDSAGEDLARQPIRDQLDAAKSAGFNTMVVLLVTGPVQSFIGNTLRKITSAKRGVPSDEIMAFYHVLPEKHKEFKAFGQKDPELGYALLDGYKILDQDLITPQKLGDILTTICVGDGAGKSYGPARKDRVICQDPDGNCIDDEAYPDYLTKELQDVVDDVNKDTKNLKQKEKPARNWKEVFTEPGDGKKDLSILFNKVKTARSKAVGDEKKMPLDVIDGFSKEADVIFHDWEVVVKASKNKQAAMEGNKLLSFSGYLLLTEGFGEEPFYLSKNGDEYNYFFKTEGKHSRGFVLTINKTPTVGTHAGNDDEFCVLHLLEIKVDALDQAVIDKGKFDSNKNIIPVKDDDLVAIFNDVAACVTDYLGKNAGIEKIYDEMPVLLKAQDYQTKMEVSFDKWPGGSNWKMQEGPEPGTSWIYTK